MSLFFDSIGDGVHFPIINQPEEDSLLNAQQRWMEEGELEAADDQTIDNKQDSPTDSADISSAELVNENEVETQIPGRTKPDILAVPENDDIQDGTAL